MAAYTDQFDRRDPLTFQPGYLFRGRLTVAVDAAQAELAGRARTDLIAIAAATGQVIDAAALVLGLAEEAKLNDDEDWYDETSEQAWRSRPTTN